MEDEIMEKIEVGEIGQEGMKELRREEKLW